MASHLSDQEQKQLIKDWWKEYGSAIILAVIVFFAGNYGWRYWNNYKIQHASQASLTYAQILSSKLQNKNSDVQLYADNLMRDSKRSPYASLAALVVAKNAVQDGKLDDALKALQWVVDHGKQKNLVQIARMRVARVLLVQGKDQEALKTLDKVNDEAFMAAIYELRGDILLKMGNKKEALQAYQLALDNLKTLEVQSPLLKLKIQALV